MSIISCTTDLGALRADLDGRVVAPADPDWDAARLAWNVLADQRPVAVAQPADAAGVAAAVRWAREAGLRVAVQGTGHGAMALGDLSASLLVRTHGLDSVTVDPKSRRARIGAGAIWEQVQVAAAPHGLAPLSGSSPDVGVAGYTLGGGLGWLSRRHGLACNSVTAFEVVTADGDLRRVDAQHDPDLFWALRGGGGSFAAVTSIEMDLKPVPDLYGGALMWPWQDANRVLSCWREWLEEVPETLSSVAKVLQLPPLPAIPEPIRGRQLVAIMTSYAGDEDTGADLMRPLRALKPELDTVGVMSPVALVRLAGDPEGPTPGLVDHRLVDDLSTEDIGRLVAAAGPGSGSPLVAFEIRHLGGALQRRPPGAGALGGIDACFALVTVGVPMAPEMGPAIAGHAARALAEVQNADGGRSYANFAERPTPASSFFDAATHARLVEVRQHWDPDSRFQAVHPVA